jgi:uncharacterized protein
MDIDLLRKRAGEGSTVAQTILGTCYLDGDTSLGIDYKEAFRLLSQAASRGASRAIFNLARMYASGLGVARDMNKATVLFEQAGARGEFLAQIELGRIYSSGTGILTNLSTAIKWYEAAVRQAEKVGDCVEIREARAFLNNQR